MHPQMSTRIDYFFNYPGDLPSLAAAINQTLGCTLVPGEEDPGDMYCRFLAMELDLVEHTLDNDGDLDFESYAYCLGIRIPAPDITLIDMQLPALALIAFALHQRLGIVGMLVKDLQILLARYEGHIDPESEEAWMSDVESGDCVILEDHLGVLNSRLPE
jgi:hypothetical protein